MNDRANAAVSDSGQLDVVGGINALGRGINKLCWPGKLHTLNSVLDAKHNEQKKIIDDKSYMIGDRVVFTRDPIGSTSIETFESIAEYDKKSSLKVNAKGRYGAFSAGFDSTFGQRITLLEEYYAGVRHDTQQLWTLQIDNIEAYLNSDFKSAVEKLPEFKEDLSTIGDFIAFFQNFGTDVITEVTVGGSLSYSVMIKKSSSSKKTDVDAAITAGYGTFVANASTSISEEEKKQAKTQKVFIRTAGGLPTDAVQFNPDQPANCHAAVQTWRKNLSQGPLVVDVQLRPIDQLFPEKFKTQQEAVNKAREWYLGYEATIEANWRESFISVNRTAANGTVTQAVAGESGLAASGEPALRIAIIGKDRKMRVDETLQAPRKNADAGAFEAFWQRVKERLSGVGAGGHEMVLLATERWPRDARYYPPADVRTLMRNHGASGATLGRWYQLVQHMQPCNIAGITYALAGKGMDNKQSDFVVAGFGTNRDTICPTVTVTARVIGGSKHTQMLVTDFTEATNTKLHVIRNVDGQKRVLAAGKQLKTTIQMVEPGEKAAEGGTYLGQYWYFLRFPRYSETPNSHFIINYETGACLQSMIVEKKDCRLQPFGDDNPPRQDDIIWDIRGTPEQTNFLVLHCWHDAHNLTQSGESATVRQWRENYMIWSLEAFNNLTW
jgi:hypothetical protein